MRTIEIEGKQCVPFPIDGKNLNDNFEELFSEFTDCVIGDYHTYKYGTFAFCLNHGDKSLFTFGHSHGDHNLVFSFAMNMYPTIDDVNMLIGDFKRMETYEGMTTQLHVVPRKDYDDTGRLIGLTISFYAEI